MSTDNAKKAHEDLMAAQELAKRFASADPTQSEIVITGSDHGGHTDLFRFTKNASRTGLTGTVKKDHI